MHSERLWWKGREDIALGVYFPADGMRSPDAAKSRVFVLRRVTEQAAAPAGKCLSEHVKDCDTPTTPADKPRTSATERAARPGQLHFAAHLRPVGRMVIHLDGVAIELEVHRSNGLAGPRPFPDAVQSWRQQCAGFDISDIDGPEVLDRRPSAVARNHMANLPVRVLCRGRKAPLGRAL